MSRNLSDFLSMDFVYKQHPDKTHIIENGNLVADNRNEIIDTILKILHAIYSNIVTINKVNPGRIECNEYLLDQALTRYSRDIFGELRLDAKIKWLKDTGRLTKEQANCLAEYSDYGLKVDSCSPYIHRKIANLFYWLSVLKPFSIYVENNAVIMPLGVAFEFHNEFISYLLILAMLKPYNLILKIHTNKEMFYDFLYDLHFRNLSRSSLEFFINSCIVKE